MPERSNFHSRRFFTRSHNGLPSSIIVKMMTNQNSRWPERHPFRIMNGTAENSENDFSPNLIYLIGVVILVFLADVGQHDM